MQNSRKEHLNKIAETKEMLKKKNISNRRKHDLEKYLFRLRKELKMFDSMIGGEV